MANEEEISKEERLEQARKKFEELKKKKKGNKKKGKAGDHERESKDKEIHDDSSMETVANTAIDLETTEATTSIGSEKPATLNNGISGTKSTIKEQGQTIVENHKFDDNDDHYDNDREGQEFSKTGIMSSSDLSGMDTVSAVKKQFMLVDETKSQYAEEIHGTAPSKQVTYLEAKLRDTVEQNSNHLKEILELKSTQARLKSRISSLEEKLQSSELLIDRLRRQLSDKTDGLSCAGVPKCGETFSNSSPQKDSLTKSSPSFQTFNSFNNLANDYLDIVDIRERLGQWKGWNLDMKSWRSVGSGSLLEL
ncbi:hypothetical protein KL948_005310 [Ogataea haglerorum]|nr:hypothetical protein KL948_005310 [Ogataea haglerorum]